MQAVIDTGDAGVVTVDGQNILRQVVRADRDKINPVRQLRQHKDHRRHFKHDADPRFRNRITDHVFHFTACTFDQPTRFVDLIDAGDHRQQDAEIARRRVGAEHRAHLDQEDLRLVERNADPTPAQARVFFADRHIGQLFIRPDVQGSQGDRFVVKHLQHALILRHLLLFRGETALQHERDFSTVQANAVDAAAQLLFMLRA